VCVAFLLFSDEVGKGGCVCGRFGGLGVDGGVCVCVCVCVCERKKV
jgi:hypothetical protein